MITGWEWIVVVAIIAVIIFWGPKKLPELARSIGEAKREFQKASRELQEASKELTSVESPAIKEPSGDDVLIQTAKKLSISTEGKTKEQISQEIVEKAKASKLVR